MLVSVVGEWKSVVWKRGVDQQVGRGVEDQYAGSVDGLDLCPWRWDHVGGFVDAFVGRDGKRSGTLVVVDVAGGFHEEILVGVS